jgi:hypothetical protein
MLIQVVAALLLLLGSGLIFRALFELERLSDVRPTPLLQVRPRPVAEAEPPRMRRAA